MKQFALDVELTLADPTLGPDIWTNALSNQLQATLVPELACCIGNSNNNPVFGTGNRCVVANANLEATYDDTNIPCSDTTNQACVRSVVLLNMWP